VPIDDATAGEGGRGKSVFGTTCWTLVLAAGQAPGGADEARRALAALCQAYWYPLYAYARRRGHAPDDAADLTQGFLARLLETNGLAAARRERGRFRSFLLASLKYYMHNEWRRDTAAKRGGGRRALSVEGPQVDGGDAEARYRYEPSHDLTPERIYDRRWALTLIDRALAAVRERYAAEGKRTLVDRLEGAIAGDDRAVPYADVAAELGMSEGAVKVAVHRLRRRYREAIRALIAETVASPDEAEDEIRELFAALDA
jgi:RNA polymerase sigma factor (sigma-70 family)